MEVENYMKLW